MEEKRNNEKFIKQMVGISDGLFIGGILGTIADYVIFFMGYTYPSLGTEASIALFAAAIYIRVRFK